MFLRALGNKPQVLREKFPCEKPVLRYLTRLPRFLVVCQPVLIVNSGTCATLLHSLGKSHAFPVLDLCSRRYLHLPQQKSLFYTSTDVGNVGGNVKIPFFKVFCISSFNHNNTSQFFPVRFSFPVVNTFHRHS